MIQAIPTTYKGIQFRSRLEARWAVFYDHLKIDWFYEYEGFQLPSGWYLPDFWIPSIDAWVEIKPSSHDDYDIEKYCLEMRLCDELAKATRKRSLLFRGDLSIPLHQCQVDIKKEHWAIGKEYPEKSDDPSLWCICSECDVIGVSIQGRGADLDLQHVRGCRNSSDNDYTYDHVKIKEAFEAARRARFF